VAQRYMVGAYWGSRRESVEQCADRLQRFLASLADCDPRLATWHEKGRSQKEALEKRINVADREHLLDLLSRGRNRRDVGRSVIEELGFNVALWNGGDEQNESALSVTCGLHATTPNANAGLSNAVVLSMPRDLGDLGRADSMARVLAAVAQAWEPQWAGVMSRDAMSTRNFNAREPFVDWMIYVPRHIDVVPAPSSVVQVPALGSILVTQPTPPSGKDPEELAGIRRLEELLQKVAA
jgi:Immunity protein 52